MTGLRSHATRFLRVACVLASLASCAPPADDTGNGRTKVEFYSAAGTGDPRFGEVSVYPLSRDVLVELESSRPSVDDWQRILAVRLATNARNDSTLPLLGTHTTVADTLRFRPRFRPAPGISYEARFDGGALYARVRRRPPAGMASVMTTTWSYDAPATTPSTVVRAIYPTADVLPMNLLRMYVEFSAPMTSGRSYDFVKLYAEGDSLVEEPFFTAGGAVELWDPQHTRLTILFDPGRIKRDLKPHEEMGLPLRTGTRYRLVIDRTWRDAEGRPLVRAFVKRFRAGPQDRSLVRTSDWRLTAPRAETRDSLIVTFPEPLDRALLTRLVSVRDSSGAAVDGEIVVSDRETRWAFAPRNPWRRAAHALRVDTELEDLAGNNLKRLFDVAPGDTAATGATAAVVRVTFHTK